ncbi:N5-glutamine S-adenosyl-L-methionine-dependent methyltransferase [Desulfuromonas sp. DDH964]|uniref:peptide chain release factor N(5)-glutamine methyltransferase n=1 Tax=Desulfuromonas sp. DDH964 TaxID=1823759 RepID=UPI00078CCA3A|nr:peptide chain release factor N(5)-glutamine methyltransferase [Desulfuromonas sp. DDH964]AMV73574.1 N5-glutamine S-adenosyl-L-methionine-dependent methyltransferase [Desulfuromonas sp. DDH964]
MAESWTVLKILKWTSGYLAERGIDNGRLDAELLLADLLQLDRVGLYLNFDRPLNAAELTDFRQRVGRRARREPLQYILGRAEFWSLPFRVGPAVLVPRPDTEVLVEEALARATPAARILDVGTGSGAIAVALAHELPAARVAAVDISKEALLLAAENARVNGVAERVTFTPGNLHALADGEFDLVVANPPYIAATDLAGLMPEVRDFEPQLALDGGSDGLDAYRALARQASKLLVPGGWLLVEVGAGQAPAVQELLAAAGFGELFCRADYAGIPRVVGGRHI